MLKFAQKRGQIKFYLNATALDYRAFDSNLYALLARI